MRFSRARQGNKVIIAWVWRGPVYDLRIGFNRTQTPKQGDIRSNLTNGYIRSEFGAYQNPLQLREQCLTCNQLEGSFEP